MMVEYKTVIITGDSNGIDWTPALRLSASNTDDPAWGGFGVPDTLAGIGGTFSLPVLFPRVVYSTLILIRNMRCELPFQNALELLALNILHESSHACQDIEATHQHVVSSYASCVCKVMSLPPFT